MTARTMAVQGAAAAPGDTNGKVRALVGIPLERNVSDLSFIAFWEIARQGYPLIPRAYCRCDIHRNEMARVLLHSPFTHLVMMDLDHIHPANTVQNLIARVEEDPQRLVVANLCFRRSAPFDPCAYWWDAEKKAYFTRTDWPAELQKVDILGHGAVIIAREVFERIAPPWWAYTYDAESYTDVHGAWSFTSDDIYFCNKCQAAGIDLWVDPTHTSPHLYQATVTKDTYLSHLKESFAAGSLNPETTGPSNGADTCNKEV
jgi:hypothetical protein